MKAKGERRKAKKPARRFDVSSSFRLPPSALSNDGPQPALQRADARADPVRERLGYSRLGDLVLLQQLRRLLEGLIARQRRLHVLGEELHVHRLVQEAEDLGLVDQLDDQIGVGSLREHDGEYLRVVLLQ